MDGTEARQRRPEELGLPHTLSTGQLPAAPEDGTLSVPEGPRVAPKPLGTELSRETALSIGLQDWPVFVEVKDLLTLVPPLVGLKGNLEMTLASRLSTAQGRVVRRVHGERGRGTSRQRTEPVKEAGPGREGAAGFEGGRRAVGPEMSLDLPETVKNGGCPEPWRHQRAHCGLPASRDDTRANMGHLDEPQEQHRVISSNLALIQVQATVVGLLAAGAALLLGAVSRQELDLTTAEVLCASSVLAAFLAAFALGVLMVCIVIGARKLGVNPDNIATPIAASLGDLITLSLLAFVSSFFYKHRDSRYLTPLVCGGFAALTPLWVLIARQSPPVLKVLKFGWVPIVLAMVISSFGGLILNKTVSSQQYKGMAVFAPIVCGVGGNLVAIQTSRVSTYLHVWSMPGVLPLWMKKLWPDPCSTFCTSEVNSTSARVLLLLAAPGHLLFFYIVCLVEGPTVPNDKTFVVLYLLAGLVQVTILLYLAEVAVRLTWHQALDPDSHCIPYLTGLGDLLGTGLLALCFLSHGLLMGGISGPVPGPS
ncbi:solute carrier family 41 member 3 isoform X3 [Camelus dromedarius]|uniref:solute carrier family 41 member 3 isoform X3 n=1 Tax=Camelus dromedarius TaxID=9838 RepID=UPI00311A6A29